MSDPARVPPPPLLRAGTRFSGVVALDRPVRIDGRVSGEIVATGTVWIGESGSVEARVEADELIVAGALRGEVRARRRIELLPTARVRAQLDTPRLVVAEGSWIRGRCRAGVPETAGAARHSP